MRNINPFFSICLLLFSGTFLQAQGPQDSIFSFECQVHGPTLSMNTAFYLWEIDTLPGGGYAVLAMGA
ncbi:MAG: hypothetical protein AAF570_16060, partial [Bacteroidota bacterium]